MVIYPDDDTKLKPLQNPLFSYKFSDTGAQEGGKGMTAEDWNLIDRFSRIQTARYPIAQKGTVGSQTMQSYVLNKQREEGVKSIVNMIRNDAYANYATFSNNHLSQGASGSLEDVHNSYHLAIGGSPNRGDPFKGQGHMSFVPVAAYDPVFWIHHWSDSNTVVWIELTYL